MVEKHNLLQKENGKFRINLMKMAEILNRKIKKMNYKNINKFKNIQSTFPTFFKSSMPTNPKTMVKNMIGAINNLTKSINQVPITLREIPTSGKK